MARPVTLLVVFFIGFNVFAGVLLSTGVAATLGLDATVGGDAAVDDATNQADSTSTGTATGGTLFGMYNVLATGFGGIAEVVYPGLEMLERAGVPTFITNQILEPLFTFAIFIDIVSFVRGWGL